MSGLLDTLQRQHLENCCMVLPPSSIGMGTHPHYTPVAHSMAVRDNKHDKALRPCNLAVLTGAVPTRVCACGGAAGASTILLAGSPRLRVPLARSAPILYYLFHYAD